MRRWALPLCAAGLVLIVATSSWARVWNGSKISDGAGAPFQCGIAPSIALLYGVQPLISNYFIYPSGLQKVVHQTAFGWEDYALQPGFIAGDGSSTIVSYPRQVTYGQDGEFYSFATDPLRPVTVHGGDGPTWPFSSNGPWAAVSADPAGTVYMAMGPTVARSFGSRWSQPVQLNLTALDLAVSPYGDIAVSGFSLLGGSKAVAWFDFKSASWSTRSLIASPQDGGSIDVEWDKMGNLGVAYADSQTHEVKFNYLDMRTGLWTTEVVNSQSGNFIGAALAFDRFGNPVIASGEYLFYDPIAVPEPSSLLALFCSLGGIGGAILRRKRQPVDGPGSSAKS